ncbi:MAG: DUF3071 domain-containing protein [Micromonosporaceae bacterium]|nr:DUF3071 domain-containing protein [Micromonosporaceae bacterium]
MRPVRFVALSEDGQALVLADEVGRLLALPRDDRVSTALHGGSGQRSTAPAAGGPAPSLSPRDIQARIRSGESADEVARIAGVPVDRVLRYAGPVLQERAMLAQHARRTRLRTSEQGAPLAEVVDGRLAQHGVDAEKISWDAYRRDDGTWRVVATWPSGKATAQAIWELDKARTLVTPHDDMAHYLCTERPTPILGQEEAAGERDQAARRPGRSKLREPSRGGHGLPSPMEEPGPRRHTGRDPIRAGRDALMASLDRPLGAAGRGLDTPAAAAAVADTSRQRAGSPFDDDPDTPKEVPAVPSLAVLRPRRTIGGGESGADAPKRKRGPSWDEVLFGSPPAARESS